MISARRSQVATCLLVVVVTVRQRIAAGKTALVRQPFFWSQVHEGLELLQAERAASGSHLVQAVLPPLPAAALDIKFQVGGSPASAIGLQAAIPAPTQILQPW